MIPAFISDPTSFGGRVDEQVGVLLEETYEDEDTTSGAAHKARAEIASNQSKTLNFDLPTQRELSGED